MQIYYGYRDGGYYYHHDGMGPYSEGYENTNSFEDFKQVMQKAFPDEELEFIDWSQ